MRTLEKALAKQMERPEFRAEYEALEPEFANMQENIRKNKMSLIDIINAACEYICFTDSQFEAITAAARSETVSPDMRECLTLLERFPWLKDKYNEHGIPDQILRDTMSDLPIWMDACMKRTGQWGISPEETGWLALHFDFKLFKLGRLQFVPAKSSVKAEAYRCLTGDVITLSIDGIRRMGDRAVAGYPVDKRGFISREFVTLEFDKWQPALIPGDPVLETHIAENEPLKPDAVKDSFARAPRFFKDHIGMSGFKAFTCESWLLDWALGEMLPGSNLAAFQAMFHCVPGDGGDWQMMERVFGNPVTDWDAAPQDTALRRAVRKWYLDGNCCNAAQGFILI